jgi:hypothetical protein
MLKLARKTRGANKSGHGLPGGNHQTNARKLPGRAVTTMCNDTKRATKLV